MNFENLPDFVKNSIGFEETKPIENLRCPKCGKDTVERRINNNWYVEHCSEKDCTYWNCGFI